MTRTVFYTATTLDGFIADEADSLAWLFAQRGDPAVTGDYESFVSGIGALLMGRTTYEWILRELGEGASWPYDLPTFVATHADLAAPEGADVRFVAGDAREIHTGLVAAAGGKDIWVVGGGDLAGQLADAGLLDELRLSIAAATLGSGRPLLPRRLALGLLSVERVGDFVSVVYDVLGPGDPAWADAPTPDGPVPA
ncbi:dihydrofolate reductase family protein [Georgenia sp. Z1344]|uniref:dihydrofolate reductase family protein n=1 Tax=Georgenia sp. Z1344 TaxID=3416706 RepID=UPI003CF14DDE